MLFYRWQRCHEDVQFAYLLSSVLVGLLEMSFRAVHVLSGRPVCFAIGDVLVGIVAAVLEAPRAETALAGGAREGKAVVEVNKRGLAAGAPQGQDLVDDVAESFLHLPRLLIHLG